FVSARRAQGTWFFRQLRLYRISRFLRAGFRPLRSSAAAAQRAEYVEHQSNVRSRPCLGSPWPLLQRRKYRCLSVLGDRKSTRLNSSHVSISYAVFCLKKKKKKKYRVIMGIKHKTIQLKTSES